MTVRPKAVFQDQPESVETARFVVGPESMATLVIFGATGDLAQRKLIPAVYNLWAGGFLPERIAVVGVARREKSDGQFREEMCEALKQFSRTGHGSSDSCDPFVSNLYYQPLRFTEPGDYDLLARRLEEIEGRLGAPGHRLYYLATAPEFFAGVVERLGAAGMVSRPGDPRYTRVVIEKPFGYDLDSARELNRSIGRVLSEDQICRIDHYLGKETVQNILAFRFGNAIFEPLFSQKYVDHVQITVAETVGMEGRRGAFYDTTGALRDVVQNHALQLMCLVAMEPPARYGAKEIRDEKLKVLNAVVLPSGEALESWCVTGQYAGGPDMPAYLAEEGVNPDSATETFAALRLRIDNWRWAGVPFFIRTGKRLKSRLTEIAIQFKQAPTHFFGQLGAAVPPANTLVFRIQPGEAISLTFSAKPPGMDFRIQPVTMDFDYGQAFKQDLPEAYERLLLDALRGDSTLFMRSDEIESAWAIITQALDALDGAPPPELYRPGGWGPTAANRLFEVCQGGWRNP